MADHEEGVQLFGQCKVCIICAKDISLDTAQQVRIFIYIDIPPTAAAVADSSTTI